MLAHRFGRKIKPPSTVAIRHQILKLALQDPLKAQVLNAPAAERIDVDGLVNVSVKTDARNPHRHRLIHKTPIPPHPCRGLRQLATSPLSA
jgi:hypothetical protein